MTNERKHVTDGECWCNPKIEYVSAKDAHHVSERGVGDGKNISPEVNVSGYLAERPDARPDLISKQTVEAVEMANVQADLRRVIANLVYGHISNAYSYDHEWSLGVADALIQQGLVHSPSPKLQTDAEHRTSEALAYIEKSRELGMLPRWGTIRDLLSVGSEQ